MIIIVVVDDDDEEEEEGIGETSWVKQDAVCTHTHHVLQTRPCWY